MTDEMLADRINRETVANRSVRKEIEDLLAPLRQWQRESIITGLYYYSEFGPGRLRPSERSEPADGGPQWCEPIPLDDLVDFIAEELYRLDPQTTGIPTKADRLARALLRKWDLGWPPVGTLKR